MTKPLNYRPWGILEWLLNRSPKLELNLIGCLGTEERSISVWEQFRNKGILKETKLFRIVDNPSRFSKRAKEKLDIRFNEVTNSGGNAEDIEDYHLTEPYGKIIESIETFLPNGDSNIVLDISSMPKRFFFPILKILLNKPEVKNLMLTYTVPKSYTYEKLVYNCDDWAPLPLFSGNYHHEPTKMLIINVGFYPMGLQDQVDHGGPGLPIKLLFPFPAPPHAVKRSWDFVKKIQKYRSVDFNLYYIDVKDMSDAFDRLVSLSVGGTQRTILAPYGPKPISAAMCIFATLTESEVYYTQPTVYHPDYSIGVSIIQGKPETYAYWLRLNGKSFYTI